MRGGVTLRTTRPTGYFYIHLHHGRVQTLARNFASATSG